MRHRRTQGVIAAALLALASSACFGRGGGASGGTFSVGAVSGSVVVRTPKGEARPLRDGDSVPLGSVIKTDADPAAFVRLEGAADQVLEIQNETQVTVVDARNARVETGRALAEASPDAAFTVESRGSAVRVAAGGAARVERLLGSLRVGVYRISARVELLGRAIDVLNLRELVIAGGIPLERAPRPLTLSATDRWDRRLLGDVLDFDRELGQFGTGFNAEFRGQADAPQFFSDFVTLPSFRFLRAQLPTSEPAEVLVGVIFAQQLSARATTSTPVPVAFAQLLELRDEGATWGLIAKLNGLDLRAVLEEVLGAIRRGTAPPAPPGTAGGGGGTGGGGGNGGGNNGGGGSKPGPEPSPTPTDEPTEPPPEEPPPEECTVLEALLGQCSETAGATGSQPPAEGCSVVGILVDPDC